MIQIMESNGGLRAEYNDRRHDTEFDTCVSLDMNAVGKKAALAGITGQEENWGTDPFFVITSQPDNACKNVLLINSENNSATFRTITEDANHVPKETLRKGADWWLDNAMMGASVQEMKIFYKYLSDYCENLDNGLDFAPE